MSATGQKPVRKLKVRSILNVKDKFSRKFLKLRKDRVKINKTSNHLEALSTSSKAEN